MAKATDAKALVPLVKEGKITNEDFFNEMADRQKAENKYDRTLDAGEAQAGRHDMNMERQDLTRAQIAANERRLYERVGGFTRPVNYSRGLQRGSVAQLVVNELGNTINEFERDRAYRRGRRRLGQD